MKKRQNMGVMGLVLAVALVAFAAPVFASEAIEVDFDAKLNTLADALGERFEPGADLNEDGVTNGDGLALVSGILANPDLDAHEAVCEAFIANRDLISDDFGMFAAVYPIDEIAAVLGAWLLWDDSALKQAPEQLYNFVTVSWRDRRDEFQSVSGIVAADGDANGDGVTNLEHYEAANGDREAFVSAALADEPGDAPRAEPIEVDFAAKLELIAGAIDSDFAPDGDVNNDGVSNGAGLALLAAILADADLAIHGEVHEAFANNRDLFVEDFQAFAAMYPVENIGAVIGAWMMWDDSELDAAARQMYNLSPIRWEVRVNDFMRIPRILAADGDVSGDGVTNLEHYEAAEGDVDAFVTAALAEALRRGEPIEVDFTAKLETIARALNDDFAPGADLNEDGLTNEAGLALVAAILANPELDAHAAVSDAYLNNRNLFARDFEPFAVMYPVEEIAGVVGAWLMWDDPAFNEIPQQLYGFVAASWNEREGEFLRVADIVSADGDVNGDGVTNHEHYEAANGDMEAFISAAAGGA